MSSQPHEVFYPYEQYVWLERSSNTKHEYLDGQIYAMGGGSPEHAALAAAIITSLGNQLAGTKCRTYSSDLRIRTTSGLTTFPDVAVVCGVVEIDTTELQAVVNPTLLVEVLSPSTERFDKGAKFEHYRSIPTFNQYVLVSYRERSIEVRTREENVWNSVVIRDGEIADLSSIGAKLNVREIYDSAGIT